jgi:integrase
MTLGELWLDYREHRQRKIEGKYSPTLERLWKRFYRKWEDKRLSEITFDKARRMILDIRKRAPIRANRIQRQGQAMFNYARRELRWKGDNPFDFALVSEKGRARKARLKPHEMPQFMKGLEACSVDMRVLFLCLLWTGRRVGEVRAMRWVDLDLDSAIWSIPNTKAGEPQEAVLPSALVKLLAQRRRKAKGTWVFPSPSKSGYVEEIKKAWKEVREASGLYHLQARDLRRTLASWAQDVNVPIAAVQAQLGHADYSTTSKYYTVISQTVQRVALDETVKSMIEAAAK